VRSSSDRAFCDRATFEGAPKINLGFHWVRGFQFAPQPKEFCFPYALAFIDDRERFGERFTGLVKMEALQACLRKCAEAHGQHRPRYETPANPLDSFCRGSVRGERALREPGTPRKEREPLLLGQSYRGLRMSDRVRALAANAVKPGVMPSRLSEAEGM
jgi:hypothetical protein